MGLEARKANNFEKNKEKHTLKKKEPKIDPEKTVLKFEPIKIYAFGSTGLKWIMIPFYCKNI